jgi:hypothetical protein
MVIQLKKIVDCLAQRGGHSARRLAIHQKRTEWITYALLLGDALVFGNALRLVPVGKPFQAWPEPEVAKARSRRLVNRATTGMGRAQLARVHAGAANFR